MLPKRDWTYSEGCGCRVTFFAESYYHTSRMDPGISCVIHTHEYQVYNRDALMERAKYQLKYLQDRGIL